MTIASDDVSEKSEEYAVFGFYGIEHSTENIDRYFRESLAWFSAHHYEPDLLGVRGMGKSTSPTSFVRKYPKLQKIGFAAITEFEMYTAKPNAQRIYRDCRLCSDYDGEQCGKFVAIRSLTTLGDLDDARNLEFMASAASYLRPIYGIGFRRDARRGPGFYVIGISAGSFDIPFSGPLYEEEVRVGHWGGIALREGIFRQGILRDVYPINYLSAVHLEKKIEGMPLDAWIKSDSKHGRIESVTDTLYIWTVDESEIAAVRGEVDKAGLIFEPKKYF